MTATEFKLLALLIQRQGHVQSREQLLRDVWEYETHIDTRTVDTHVRRLREKLGLAAKYLDTVRGVGYRFMPGVKARGHVSFSEDPRARRWFFGRPQRG